MKTYKRPKRDKTPQELTGPTIRGKQYPKGTIVTNDPEVYQRNQDSLSMHNKGRELFNKEIGDGYQRHLKDYNDLMDSSFLSEEDKQKLYKPKLSDFRTYSEKDMSSYEPEWYITEVENLINSNRNIKPTGYFSGEGVAYGAFYKKPSNMVYEDKINRIQSKGILTLDQSTPQMLNMPDRIEMDSKKGAEYKGINVSHYTDGLGRYTAKLNLSTTPGVRGKISYPKVYKKNP